MAADPQSRAFVQLADEYLKCGLFEEAIGVLSEGISYHPMHVAARMMRGKIYLKTKQVKEAKDEFEAVAQIYPENILAQKNLVHIYRELGQLGVAITVCKKILMIDPKDQETKVLLTSIQQEISVMEEIHSLSATSQKAEASFESSYLLSDSDFTGVTISPFSTTEVFSVIGEKHLFPLQNEADVDGIRDEIPAEPFLPTQHEDDATAIQVVRLKGWLASIQEKKEDEFQGKS